MKKIILSAISLASLTVSANAATTEQLLQEIRALKAENAALRSGANVHNSKVARSSNSVNKSYTLPKIKGDHFVDSVIVPEWSGFYAGLNAGYGWGTNSNTSANLWETSSWNVIGNLGFTNYNVSSGAPLLGGAIGHNHLSMTQSGFIGGAQFGYNHQWGKSILIGIETDIQGTSMRGWSSAGGLFGAASSANGVGSISRVSFNANQNGYGVSTVSAGVDWLGTVRGRIGYVWSPTIMVYGTAGLAYGGAWANVNTNAVSNILVGISGNRGVTNQLSASQTYFGGGSSSAILLGYTAGGGAEWMFLPNWSLKGEALYYNLGNMNIATTAIAAPSYGLMNGIIQGAETWQLASGSGVAAGNTRVNYQGVIARAGINYHFNFGNNPVVAKF